MKRLISIFIVAFCSLTLVAQEDYNRSSLYIIPLLHPGTGMYDDIFSTAIGMQIPDRYNDHSLSMLVLADNVSNPKPKDQIVRLQTFLERNQIAKRLVARWFCRDKQTGTFSMDLVAERGLYNASAEDIRLAMQTTRGKALLADAGEQLIGQTFVIFNDITYYDKESKAQTALGIFQMVASAAEVAGGVAGTVGGTGGNMAAGIADMTRSLSDLGGVISDQIAGFMVDVHSYLFRLEWNDETAAKFYADYWCDADSPDPARKAAFEADKTTFRMEYIGDYSARSSKTVMRGLNTPQDVFHKVMTRATDKNIVELQKKFPVFKVSAPLVDAENGIVRAHIGLKEGVNPKSKYEVLERRRNDDGTIVYERRATLVPDKDLIWDNRCMAVEEMADNAELGATSFRITQGNADNLYRGMILREIR
ncbi:MAG: hypothetical protein J5635_03610 [Paludibacteraceae bacterium]|nr:hypothetical protein [Paludibacteraceae bacterium]